MKVVGFWGLFVCLFPPPPPATLSQQEVVFYFLLPSVEVTTSVQFCLVIQAVRAVPGASPGTQGTRVGKSGADGLSSSSLWAGVWTMFAEARRQVIHFIPKNLNL